MNGMRYFRWRTAIKKPIWVLDQYWYMMLGRLYMLDHPELRKAPEETPSMGTSVPHRSCSKCAPCEHQGEDASFGEVKPDGG